MPITFESSRTYAGVGAILLAIGIIIPVIGIIGIVLLLIGLRGLANYYKDSEILKNTFYGFFFCILGAILFTLMTFTYIPALVFSIINNIIANPMEGTVEFVSQILIDLVAIISVLFVLFLLESIFFNKIFKALALQTGKKIFKTTGLLLLIGSVLIIVMIGFVVLLITWLVIAITIFSIKVTNEKKKI
jgi:uncharacterized membrane protein